MRRNQVIAALCMIILIFGAAARSSAALAAGESETAKRGNTMLKGEVGASARMGGSVSSSPLGYEVTSTSGKATISKVVAGSEAWARGLQAGDTVVGQQKNGNTLSITIQRAGKTYQANLTTGAPAATPAKTALVVGGTVIQQQLNIMSDHNVYLIIDKSGSMATRDCPGSASRWKWCAQQTQNLTEATAASGCFSEGITVVVFSDAFSIYHHATVKDISEIFENNQPDGTTNTGDALESQIDDYFIRKSRNPATKPAVIAVVTDGEPNKPEQVTQVIIDATKRMSDPNELSITFLQVGTAPFGASLLYELDNNLVYEGAYYDIVDTKSFGDLEKIGLLGAIAQAITALRTPSAARPRPATAAIPIPVQQIRPGGGGSRVVRQPTHYSSPVPPASISPEQQLRRAEQERNDIERKLLEN